MWKITFLIWWWTFSPRSGFSLETKFLDWVANAAPSPSGFGRLVVSNYCSIKLLFISGIAFLKRSFGVQIRHKYNENGCYGISQWIDHKLTLKPSTMKNWLIWAIFLPFEAKEEMGWSWRFDHEFTTFTLGRISKLLPLTNGRVFFSLKSHQNWGYYTEDLDDIRSRLLRKYNQLFYRVKSKRFISLLSWISDSVTIIDEVTAIHNQQKLHGSSEAISSWGCIDIFLYGAWNLKDQSISHIERCQAIDDFI